ncbi:MAG: methyltransferase domain-containing protein [DPANN group archaeon]|nr:methyltransferase domain-containing protein [DPANN group archaeon]
MASKKFSSPEYAGLVSDPENLRFATNEQVARYRAERLACNHLIEIGAGIGFQTIAFARTCKRVTAIELDRKRCDMLRKNLEKTGITNVRVIQGDALADEVIASIDKAEWLFCDPERLPEEKERSLDRLRPSPRQIRDAYKEAARKFCFEVPPQLQNIPKEYDREYISLHHKLNRLQLYHTPGSASKGTTGVVLLPEGEVLAEQKGKRLAEGKQAKKYLYEIDAAVEKAGLIDSLPVDAEKLDRTNRTLLTSEKRQASPFLCCYRVLKTAKDREELQKVLSRMKGDRVVIRYPIAPEQYWKERKELESRLLPGKRTLHVFGTGQRYAITEKT